jgi:hypothetical protein
VSVAETTLNLLISRVFSDPLEISPTSNTFSSVVPFEILISSEGPTFLIDVFCC